MKKTISNIVAILLTGLVLSLAACTYDVDNNSKDNGTSTDSNTDTGGTGGNEKVTYSIGDIILTDGSKIDAANVETYTASDKNLPIGVVALLSDSETPYIIGLKHSDELAWAKMNTTGYTTSFTGIASTCTRHDEVVEGQEVEKTTYTFEGDTDGSDNWDYIKQQDSTGTADAATNYPAFNFANTYSTTANLSDKWSSGWYVPSIAELYKICKNKDILNTSLTKVGGDIVTSWDSQNFVARYYWSSTQRPDETDTNGDKVTRTKEAWFFDFENNGGTPWGDVKYESSKRYVLVIRSL